MARKSYRVKFSGGEPGIQLAGIVDRPHDQSDCPVLVFSHCFTCNKDLKATVRISRALADLGVAVLRFDMRGLGGSEGDFSWSNFTTNMADLRAAIQFGNQEIGPVTSLMGHSFGGAASLAVAANQPEELKKLGCVVTLAAPSDTSHLAALLAAMNPAIEQEGTGEVSIGGLKWQIRNEMLADFRSHDLTKLIPKIRVPVLLIHSPCDRTVRYDHALRLQGLIQGAPQPHATVSLLSLKDSDHLLAEDPNDIQYVASTVAAFVDRYSARSSDGDTPPQSNSV